MNESQGKRGLGSIADPRGLLVGLFEHSPVAFQVYRADGHCLLVNQAFRALFGSEPPPEYNVLDDDVLERQGFLDLVRRAFAGETVHVPPLWYDPRELRQLEVREGRRVGVEVTLFPLRDAGGRIEHVALCFKDVTAELERERERDLLKALEEELAATLDSIGDAVIATDTQGRVVRMNPVAERLTGWQLEEAAGLLLSAVFHILNEDTRRAVESPVDRVLREGVVVGLANHTALVARDGTERAIADSGAPIRDATGAIRGVVLVFRDQTEERNAERALRESEARKAAVLEAALDCIVTIDHEGAIIEFNPAAEKTFGYARDQALGKLLVDLLVPAALRDRHREGFRRYLATGEGTILGRRVELPALRADGTEFPVELTVVRNRSDGPPMFTGYIREITERKSAEEAKARLAAEAREESAGRQRAELALLETEQQLRQSQKMEAIGKLAGGIAHDFNNLLCVIQSYPALILKDLRADDPMHAELTQVLRAGERASDLTRQLLAFSRQQVLSPRVVLLNDIIEGMSGMLRRMIGEDIEIAFALGAKGNVKVDAGQMEQVLLNLVVNARDAMPAGGKLTIETSDVDLDAEYAREHVDVEPGAYTMLGVSDTGVGMDKKTQQRIFEPFFTTKGQGRGTGLGLSTAFGIVKQSGGGIWVYSEPGHGATFKVYLPRSRDAVTSVDAPPAPAGTLRGSETILLVEDDEQVRELAYTVLRKHGYRVLDAATGGDALLICEQHQGTIHALLTDVVLPRMSGRQLAERLASLRPAMKVIYMSGYTQDAFVHRDVLSSDAAFIQKPLMPESFLTKIREVLDAGGRR